MIRATPFLLILCVLFAVAFASDNHHVRPSELFRQFKERYAVSYATAQEEATRYGVFIKNLEVVRRLNEQHVQAGGQRVFGVSKFMDLTAAEFKARYLNNAEVPETLPEAPSTYVPPAHPQTIPQSFDWKSRGVITAVKNQEQCGSCWAFSATETIESSWALAGNTLIELAPQQIVDCDPYDYGCNGGWPYNAYKYVIGAKGQELETSYPYQGVQGTCEFNANLIAAKISTWQWVNQDPSTEDTTMLNFVAQKGPVSVCVDASTWQYYTGGVLRQCTDNVDHCVQVTGYQPMNGTNVWNVRNSWGAWGDDDSGYIYIERGLNLCLIATYVTSAS